MKENLLKKCGIFIALLMIISACAGLKNPTDMNPKDFSIWANRAYIQAYDSYIEEISKPDLTVDQKNFLAKKRAILVELQPKLVLYGSYLSAGVLPEAEVTQAIIELIEKLVE